jgi:alpha-tubulin suppressor-like RCC1 family protein
VWNIHNLNFLDDGKVWGCGFTKFGQLGNHDIEKVDKLTVLQTKFMGRITDIKAHGWSTLILAEKK